jgi:hypothetical protein
MLEIAAVFRTDVHVNRALVVAFTGIAVRADKLTILIPFVFERHSTFIKGTFV